MSGELEYFGVPPAEQRELERRADFTASDSQTSFSFTYTIGYVDAFRNGVKTTAFTAADGATVVFAVPCVAGEEISLRARRQVPVTDVYTQAETNALTQAFYGVASGTGDAATVNTVPSVGFALIDGLQFKVRWPGVNTVINPTINPNSTGAKTVVTAEGYPLAKGVLTANHELTLRYNITKNVFEAVNIDSANLQTGAELTDLFYPSLDGMWRDVYRAGWKPSGFNQYNGGWQYGVEIPNPLTGAISKFDVATGCIMDDTYNNLYSASTDQYWAIQFRVSEATSISQVWLKLFKQGNPTDNVIVKIYDNTGAGGTPGAQVGSGSASVSSVGITSNTTGEWYPFDLSSSASLTTGQNYYVRIERSGAMDGTNCVNPKSTTFQRNVFPASIGYGQNLNWNGSAWVNSAFTTCHMIVNPATSRVLQSGGKFSARMIAQETLYPGFHKSLTQPLVNFFDGKHFTYLIRVNNATKDRPIADFAWGQDHDRIVIRSEATTGNASVTLFDKNKTSYFLDSTVDISTATYHDVAIVARMYGDGSDYLKIYVDGVQKAGISGQTFAMEDCLRENGTAYLGGGLAPAPTWAQDLQMGSLPSAQGWTWTGTASEANAMAIVGSKLIQRRTGFGATESGVYRRTNFALNNATGWSITARVRVQTSNGNPNTAAVFLGAGDGTKAAFVTINYDFIQFGEGGSASAPLGTAFVDFRKDRIVTICAKGDDFYVYVDGKLIYDGSGRLLTTGMSQSVSFGDNDTSSSENSDAIWSYVKVCNTGPNYSQVSSGLNVHEAAHWSGDNSVILPSLYNAGTPNSVKRFCGIFKNYVNQPAIYERRRGTTALTTTNTTPTNMGDTEAFVLGDSFETSFGGVLSSTVAGGGVNSATFLDGLAGVVLTLNAPSAGSNSAGTMSIDKFDTYVGLHKVEGKFWVSSGTGNYGSRSLMVKGVK